AFAILIPALYFPILVMLLALVFRGVAFEFRFRDVEHKTFWDHGFFYGSLIATLAQGMMLGAFIQGFKVEGRAFAGGPLDFFTPFSVDRHCARLRLRAPGRWLAGAQDRGRHPGTGAPLWPRLPGGCGDRDRGGESMDAAGERCSLQPLVLLAEHPHFVAGA